MKPARFEYHAPTELKESLKLLAEHAQGECRILAGGQSLVPMMALRLAFPEHLVDINCIDALNIIEERSEGLYVGALKRHDDFAAPVTVNPLGALLATVQKNIAHYPVRKRGTMCGSLAHADPASEWCLVAATLGCQMDIRSAAGERTLAAENFFAGVMTTNIEAEEMLAGVTLPLLSEDTGFGFYEFNRRAGDFGMVICLAVVRCENQVVTEARIGVGGAEPHPRRLNDAEAVLLGRRFEPSTIVEAAEVASRAIDPFEDPEVPTDYRRDLVATAVKRALSQAATSVI